MFTRERRADRRTRRAEDQIKHTLKIKKQKKRV